MKFRLVSAAALWIATASVFGAPSNSGAYITNQGGGVSILSPTTYKEIGKIAVGQDPRGLSITPDGRWLLTANQGSADVSVIDLSSSKEVRRIPVGKNVEFMRISADGERAFVTYEPSAKAGGEAKGKKDGDDLPAEIAVIDLKKWSVIGRMKAAPETEGLEFSADGKSLVVANEGDNSLGVYDLMTLRESKRIDLSKVGNRPRGVKISPDGSYFVVTFENSNNFAILDRDFKTIKSVPTEKGPYGIGFDREGNRVWIASARSDRIQVFDTKQFTQVASIPVGKRCWHFTFTPDGNKVMVACGRSNTVEVIDVEGLKVTETLTGFNMPWGIVTYPKSPGSLDAAVSGTQRQSK